MNNPSNETQHSPVSKVFFIHNPNGTKKPATLDSCDDIEGCSPCVYFKPWVSWGINCKTRATLEENRNFARSKERFPSTKNAENEPVNKLTTHTVLHSSFSFVIGLMGGI